MKKWSFWTDCFDLNDDCSGPRVLLKQKAEKYILEKVFICHQEKFVKIDNAFY